MNSPFPGMDPYIEACGLWGDFDSSLVVGISRQLAEQLPERYVSRIGSRSYFAVVDDEAKATYPVGPNPNAALGTGAGDDSGPRTIRAFVEEEHREGFVEIYEGGLDRRLVTRIE